MISQMKEIKIYPKDSKKDKYINTNITIEGVEKNIKS